MQHLNIDEFKEALVSLDFTPDKLKDYELEGEILHYKDGKLNVGEMKVGSRNLNAGTLRQTISDHSSLPRVSEEQAQFKKVKDNAARNNFGDSLTKINDIKTAKEGTKEFF